MRPVVLALATFGGAACYDVASPAPRPIPPFVFVADANGFSNLVRFRNDSMVALTSGSNNTEPNSAASRLVFTSTRDGHPQLYISDLDIASPHRVMASVAFDISAALSPSADSIAFVSTRSGTPRIWIIRAPGLDTVGYDTPVALATGSPDYVPESAPAWRPTGGVLAFTSTRDGASQVYVVASAGGAPNAVTNEVGGAFQPAWSADGSVIYYIAATPALTLRRVPAVGGPATTVIPDTLTAGGPASCDASYCLFPPDANAPTGAMMALSLPGRAIRVVFPRTSAQERQPAILVK